MRSDTPYDIGKFDLVVTTTPVGATKSQVDRARVEVKKLYWSQLQLLACELVSEELTKGYLTKLLRRHQQLFLPECQKALAKALDRTSQRAFRRSDYIGVDLVLYKRDNKEVVRINAKGEITWA